MARYRFKAATTAGEVVEGELEGNDRGAVVERLRRQGHLPIRVEPLVGIGAERVGLHPLARGQRLPSREVALMTRELATLLKAGLPLDRALALLHEMADGAAMRKLADRLLQAVRGGASLSQALELERTRLPAIYIGMVNAGETGGALEDVLTRLADALERAQALKEAVRSALTYPLLVLVVAVGSLLVLLTVVLPEFKPLFEGSGAPLPASTAMLIALGDGLSRYWWAIALGAALIGCAVVAHDRTPVGRMRRDRLLLRLPLLGGAVQQTEVSRFCRTLGTLIGNGVPILDGLKIAGDAITNQAVAQGLRMLGHQLRRGERMAPHLARSQVFPRLAVQLVQVGEESGELAAMLLRVSDLYDEEVKRTVQRLMTLLVPAITIGLGLLVAGIVASMLTAILSVYNLTL